MKAKLRAAELAPLAFIVGAAYLVARAAARPVRDTLAYYYIWYTGAAYPEWPPRDRPLLGEYRSDDPDVIRQHIRWARAAGITGWIVCWSHLRDWSFAPLAEVARRENFKLHVCADMPYLSLEDRAREMTDLVEAWAGRSPFRAVDGKMAVHTFMSYQYAPELWEPLLAPLRDRAVFLHDGFQFDDPAGPLYAGGRYLDVFDGLSPYLWYGAQYVEPHLSHWRRVAAQFALAREETAARGKLWVAPCNPMYDDTWIRTPGAVQNPMGTDQLRRTYATAVETLPDAVSIVSWNEWPEQSHVEPSTVYGSRFIDALAELT